MNPNSAAEGMASVSHESKSGYKKPKVSELSTNLIIVI